MSTKPKQGCMDVPDIPQLMVDSCPFQSKATLWTGRTVLASIRHLCSLRFTCPGLHLKKHQGPKCPKSQDTAPRIQVKKRLLRPFRNSCSTSVDIKQKMCSGQRVPCLQGFGLSRCPAHRLPPSELHHQKCSQSQDNSPRFKFKKSQPLCKGCTSLKLKTT